CGQGTHCPYSF
nr:immunoglobulin light chain junction region [Macaca mulatta]